MRTGFSPEKRAIIRERCGHSRTCTTSSGRSTTSPSRRSRAGVWSWAAARWSTTHTRASCAEDVAAIWQAEQKLHRGLEQFEAWVKSKQDAFNAASQAEFAALNARWDRTIGRINERLRTGRCSRSPVEGIPALDRLLKGQASAFDTEQGPALKGWERGDARAKSPALLAGQRPGPAVDDFENASVIDENAIKSRQELEVKQLETAQGEKWKAIELEVAAEQNRQHLVKGSGFSLDPDYDFEGLAQFVERLVRELEEFSAAKGPSAIPAPEFAAIGDALKRNDLGPYRALLDRLDSAEGSFASVLHRHLWSTRLAVRSVAGDVDVEGLSRRLVRLETELDALADGRWPDGSASDFGPMTQGPRLG